MYFAVIILSSTVCVGIHMSSALDWKLCHPAGVKDSLSPAPNTPGHWCSDGQTSATLLPCFPPQKLGSSMGSSKPYTTWQLLSASWLPELLYTSSPEPTRSHDWAMLEPRLIGGLLGGDGTQSFWLPTGRVLSPGTFRLPYPESFNAASENVRLHF